jgi:hypothetical protein
MNVRDAIGVHDRGQRTDVQPAIQRGEHFAVVDRAAASDLLAENNHQQRLK